MLQVIGLIPDLSSITLDYLNDDDKKYYIGKISDRNICEYAAKNGYLELLKESHERGCHWNAQTCTAAALNGYLDCLRYAHENGCP